MDIDTSLKNLGLAYESGTLAWLKQSSPGDWKKMLSLEQEINRLASESDEKGLSEALDKYERFILKVIDVYSNYPVFEMSVEEEDGKKTVLFSDRILPVYACSRGRNTGTDDSKLWQEKIQRNTAKRGEEKKQQSFVWSNSRNGKDGKSSEQGETMETGQPTEGMRGLQAPRPSYRASSLDSQPDATNSDFVREEGKSLVGKQHNMMQKDKDFR